VKKEQRKQKSYFEIVCVGIGLLVVIGLVAMLTQAKNPQKAALDIVQTAEASIYGLPEPTTLISTSKAHSYPVLKGLKIDPNDPFRLEFIVDREGQADVSDEEMTRLVNYFLAFLTIPEEDVWVNLSPYEGERVTSPKLALTDLGKDLLGEDYILKQLVSSLTYPETELGKRYWDKVYEEIHQLAGTTNIPINTFNKVWIVPKVASVVEKGNIGLIDKAELKAMHEEDFLALQKNVSKADEEEISKVSSKVMKEIILPEIERDINQGENFAKLRQAYHSYILASWFKKKLKDTLFQYYIGQGKIEGIDLEDKDAKDKIFNLYVEAYKKGVYNYTKNDYDPNERKYIQRQYYSGGVAKFDGEVETTQATSEQIAAAGDDTDNGTKVVRTAEVGSSSSPSKVLSSAKVLFLETEGSGDVWWRDFGGILKQAGAEITKVTNLDEVAPAEEAFSRAQYDVVIANYSRQNQWINAIIDAIRKRDNSIPIIALAGKGEWDWISKDCKHWSPSVMGNSLEREAPSLIRSLKIYVMSERDRRLNAQTSKEVWERVKERYRSNASDAEVQQLVASEFASHMADKVPKLLRTDPIFALDVKENWGG